MLYPLARRAKLEIQRIDAARRVRSGGPVPAAPEQQIFIVGCGRSGTTILGRALAMREGLGYVHDQVHLWGSIDPRLDLNNLFFRGESKLCWDEPATGRQRERFARLFFEETGDTGVLVEKTPHNVYRIGWLRDLLARPRFIHIMRDGDAVVRSIERLGSGRGKYRIFGRADYNQWWGSNGAKWRCLARECAALGYWPEAVARLTTHADRGAYEWLTSLGEADRWRDALGDDWFDMTYESLATDPRGALSRLAQWIGLDADDAWLDRAGAQVHPPREPTGSVELDPTIAEAFNVRRIALGYQLSDQND